MERQRPPCPSRRFLLGWTSLRAGCSLALLLGWTTAVSRQTLAESVEKSPRTLVAQDAGASLSIHRGKVMQRALRSDPSQHYYYYVPSKLAAAAPVFVTVHGISRNVEEHATLFAPYAEKYGVVLVAPFFTRDRNGGYQWLGRDESGRRADATLDAILEEVGELTGADTKKFLLFGFSGGAQFAHRYTLAHPERVAGAAVGAAGWYTFPDRTKPYPYGLGPSPERMTLQFDPQKFLRVPITVFVGENDTGEENVRRSALLDKQQGVTRLERAQNWVAAMRRAATRRKLPPVVTCQRVAGIEHSFKQFMEEGNLGARVFETLLVPSLARGSQP